MNYFLLGKGKVGSAILRHFKKTGLPIGDFNIENTYTKVQGILFLAVSDSNVAELWKKISNTFQDLDLIHFSAASDTEDMNLLHPYCSVGQETDLGSIVFTFWTKRPQYFKEALNVAGFKWINAGKTPSPLYHASAVMSGNFSQFFYILALELLKNQGFDSKDSIKLLNQLMISSLTNIKHGIKGITGPASRGDFETIEKEAFYLAEKNPQIAKIFKKINKLINKLKAMDNGSVLRK